MMKDLVIYLTQGPKPVDKPERNQVLHFDVVGDQFKGRSQIEWEQLEPWEVIVSRQQKSLGLEPHHVPCNCRKCFSPLCLFYGSKSENGGTGGTHWHLKTKKLRGQFPVCPINCHKCYMWVKGHANRLAAKAAKEAAAAATTAQPSTSAAAAATASASVGSAEEATPGIRRSGRIASRSNNM